MPTDLTAAYLRWELLRAALARGYWTVTAVYLVLVADLAPQQLILIGTFQGITVLLAEIPAGVVADAVGRRRSLVIGHVVAGIGMCVAGSVTAFPLLVLSQCLWGLGWAFQSGADVAWITDELDEPSLIDRVLVARARRDLTGRTIGIVAFAALAWATSLATAVVASGVGMVVLGVVVVARWPERGFVPVGAARRWRGSRLILRRGMRVARADRVILVVLGATLLCEGSLEAHGRLVEQRLLTIGIPTHPDPIVWFAALGVVGYVLGALVLRIVEARVTGVLAATRTYVASCLVGVLGLLLFAHPPDATAAVAGALLVGGVSRPIARATAAIWINQRVPSAVRATVHSILSQVISLSGVVIGLTLAVLADATSTTVTLTAAAGLVGAAALLARRADDGPTTAGDHPGRRTR